MRLLLLCLILAASCMPARAEIVCGRTLEWLADTCPYVGIYTCKHVSVLSPDCLQVEASLANKLRGVGPESVSFSYPNPSAQWNSGGSKPETGDKFMVFLRDAGANDIRLENVISLTKPICGCELSAALEPDFSVLTEGPAIEKVVKDRIAAKPLNPNTVERFPR